jgi:hypothetical protein
MLRQALHTFMRSLFLILLGGAAILGAHKSAEKSLTAPTEAEINSLANVGSSLSEHEARAVIRSRQSAVLVMSMDIEDGISASSGTYITYKGKYFILTTSHGVGPHCAFTQVVLGEEMFDCTQYVLRDPQTDYVVFQIDPLPHRTPVRIPADTPHRREWVTEIGTQNSVFYTGFPNQGGPYTFDGKVVGYRAREAIFVDSYGWSGSSGAGVFSHNGNLIGWVMALEVGETYFGRQVLENFIWVIPLFKVDWLAVGAFAE